MLIFFARFPFGNHFDSVAKWIKVEMFLEQREVAFLSPSKICEDLNFSTEIQIFVNFAGC